jgi:membrane fusion protein, multidrug efflux system
MRKSALACAAALCAFPPGAGLAGERSGVRGIVRASDEAVLSSDLGRRIIELPVKESGAFKQGDVLARFDCDSGRANLTAARAKQRVEQIGYENTARLAKMRAAGRFEVNLAKARTEQAAAEADGLGISLNECEIKAPFAGLVAELSAHVSELPERTQPLMRIIGTARLEVDMIVPSDWLAWIKPGAAFVMRIDETGKDAPASILRLGAVVDPVSQTVKAVGELSAPDPAVRPGMSGSVTFEAPNG